MNTPDIAMASLLLTVGGYVGVTIKRMFKGEKAVVTVADWETLKEDFEQFKKEVVYKGEFENLKDDTERLWEVVGSNNDKQDTRYFRYYEEFQRLYRKFAAWSGDSNGN